MASPDLLFNLWNLFYLGAYQATINIDVPGLDAAAAAERDAIVFRSYIALGSYQLEKNTRRASKRRFGDAQGPAVVAPSWVLLFPVAIVPNGFACVFNRPMEISTKVRPPKLREVIQVPKKVGRDPRFEPAYGFVDKEGCKLDEFLTLIDLVGMQRLQKMIKKSKDLDAIGEMKSRVTWINVESEILREHIKKEREAAKAGKRPYYLKKPEFRERKLMNKYNELKEECLQRSSVHAVPTLGNNELRGRLPAGLSGLRDLQYLILENNPMGGVPLPPELGNIPRLQELRLANSGYSGPIPDTFGLLSSLTTLSLENNNLTGRIPPGLSRLKRMYHLNLSKNGLDGVVPFDAAFLRRLGRNLDLSGNPGLCVTDRAVMPGVGVGVCGDDVVDCERSAAAESSVVGRVVRGEVTTGRWPAGLLRPAAVALCSCLLL
ncbi:Putative DUF947 domain containing family protein [Zea mays]|uniref:rRNA biogenesis protein RRP36 n=1 Tax=Zea mays TaxID=4577 RepID=A0A1D6NV20_MAIZE|nr:Putative DUF947 domain containing family protein [Zea mays]